MGGRGAYMHHVPKSVMMIMTMIITPKTNKPAFRQLQKSTLSEMQSSGDVEVTGDNIYTKRLYYGNDEKESIIGHCYDPDELRAAKDLQNRLPTLKNGVYETINMSRKNANKKIQNGTKYFVKYEYKFEGEDYVLKCAARQQKEVRNGQLWEYPYSLKKKKK